MSYSFDFIRVNWWPGHVVVTGHLKPNSFFFCFQYRIVKICLLPRKYAVCFFLSSYIIANRFIFAVMQLRPMTRIRRRWWAILMREPATLSGMYLGHFKKSQRGRLRSDRHQIFRWKCTTDLPHCQKKNLNFSFKINFPSRFEYTLVGYIIN